MALLSTLAARLLSAAESCPVLAAARAAVGARPVPDAGLIRESGSEETSGLTGRWHRVTDLATGRTRESTDFGIFSTTEVWDGKNDWRQDASGGVHPIDSSFMHAVHLTSSWLAQLGYLQPGVLGARMECLGDKTSEGRSYVVIRATPPNGEPVELWFDERTSLLARTVQVMSNYVQTTQFEDYRQVGDFHFPHKITRTDGVLADTDVIRIKQSGWSEGTDSEFSRPRSPADFTIADGKTTIPLIFDGDVVVEAKLNGQGPFAFILDTGGHDILTPAAVRALGLRPVGAGASGGSGEGTLPVQYVRVRRVELGGMTMRDQPFAVIPLQFDTVERGPSPVLAGILGLELFERFAIRLNYRSGTLTLQPLTGYQHRGGGTAVPIFFGDDQPLAVAEIDGIAGDVGLDTGNSGTLVVQGIWADNHGLKQQMMRGYPGFGFGTGGVSTNWTSRADLQIAGRSFPRIIAHYAADKAGAFSSRTEAGNVGNEILANFVLDVDYARGQIWFEPLAGAAFAPFTRLGASVYKEHARAFKVAAVAAGTPAAEAGLQVDDEIVAVDGQPSQQLSGWDFGRASRRAPGTTMTLSLVRKGVPQTVVVVLRELLP